MTSGETPCHAGGNQQNVPAPPNEGVAGGGTSYGWTDSGLGRSSLTKGIIDPTKIPSTDLVHVWCMPSTGNIGQQEPPQPLEPMSILASKNERESFQIAIRPKVSWSSSSIAGTVQIKGTDLCFSSNRLVFGQSVTLRRVAPILGVPDALVPLDPSSHYVNLYPCETTSLWLSIDVPCGQLPGLYEGEILITAVKTDLQSSAPPIAKCEAYQLYRELKSCLEIIEPVYQYPLDKVIERAKTTSSTLKRVLELPIFEEYQEYNGAADMMDEDVQPDISVSIKISVTVWDFTLPVTPSLPAVFGISETVIEDRFCLDHGTAPWHDALDRHFKWLLRYRISPFFCRWGENMQILAYTCPWPANHPRAEEYYADPRLAAYAVPYAPILSCTDISKRFVQREVEILKMKDHWRKAYFYLWDEPRNMQQYDIIRSVSKELHTYAADVRILTTYYCGPTDAESTSSTFESFVNVPNILRPDTQIFCASEWVFGGREDLVKNVMAELHPELGEELWTYVCMGPPDPLPNWHLGMRGTQHRAVMWRVWKEGGTGFLYWGTNCYEKSTVPSAEIKFRHGLPPGDGVLFYPGEVFSSSHEPVASVRLERILSGMQDIEYLNLYTSRYGRLEALLLLERSGVYISPDRYTSDHRPIDVMRWEIYRTCKS